MANGYWGLVVNGSTSAWVRTTTNGIIPVQSGAAGSGHCSLGTSSWYFSTAYIDTVYGSLNGKIIGKSYNEYAPTSTSTNIHRLLFYQSNTATASGSVGTDEYCSYDTIQGVLRAPVVRAGVMKMTSRSYVLTISSNTLSADRAIKFPNASGTVSLEGHTHSIYVTKRDNGCSYNNLASLYTGGSTKKYIRITVPKGSSTWTMCTLEITLKANYSTGLYGKILFHGNWSSGSDWNNLKAELTHNLGTEIKMYASDKTYIYITGHGSYATCTVDKMTMGDNAVNHDLSAVTIAQVDSLPSTYQTVTMTYHANYSVNGHTHSNYSTTSHTHGVSLYSGSGSITSGLEKTTLTLSGNFSSYDYIVIYLKYNSSINVYATLMVPGYNDTWMNGILSYNPGAANSGAASTYTSVDTVGVYFKAATKGLTFNCRNSMVVYSVKGYKF